MPIVVEWGPNQANAMQLSHRAGFNQEQYTRGMQLAQFLQQARQQHAELQLGHRQLGQQESQFARTLPLQERGVAVQERGATVQEQQMELARKQLEQERFLQMRAQELQRAIAQSQARQGTSPPYKLGYFSGAGARDAVQDYNDRLTAGWFGVNPDYSGLQ